jgi:hypothetical protein
MTLIIQHTGNEVSLPDLYLPVRRIGHYMPKHLYELLAARPAQLAPVFALLSPGP